MFIFFQLTIFGCIENVINFAMRDYFNPKLWKGKEKLLCPVINILVVIISVADIQTIDQFRVILEGCKFKLISGGQRDA